MDSGRNSAHDLGSPSVEERYAVVLYQKRNDDHEGLTDQNNSNDYEDEESGEVLRTNWYHLKSEEYLEANSIQCPNCLRRFSPENLVNHERSCFRRQHLQAVGSDSPDHTRNSPLVECFLCGKKFGTHSIGIHEPQCLKKWKLQHGDENPPENPRRPVTKVQNKDMPKFTRPRNIPTPPLVGDGTLIPDPAEQRERVRSAWADFLTKEDKQSGRESVKTIEIEEREHLTSSASPSLPSGNPRKPITCQICGKSFAVPAFPAHQKLCLSIWRRANKHPNSTRQRSAKSDYVFKVSERADSAMQAAWKNHLSQLVPCKKCGRTFNPDRVEVHERCCRGEKPEWPTFQTSLT